MTYKGYRIVLSYTVNTFYEVNRKGEQGEKLEGIQYQTMFPDDPWYAVVGEDNWVQQTFETIKEAKEYIDEETDVPEMELKVPYIKPKNAKSEREVA